MSKKSYTDGKLLIGNCLDTLKTLPDNSIDSVVTDPPYELGFMGKSWDNTGIAFNVAVWQECMRVLKPGGHLLAFSSSRTYHRMAVAIEDAGFEIRDQIMWIYGSGFPKSYNVAKGIEGLLTNGSASWNKWHELNGELGEANGQGANGLTKLNASQGNRPEQYASHGSLQLDPTTKQAKHWQGWGTALKPAHEPIVVARKPISEKTVAANVLTYGTGAINIDASRVGYESTPNPASNPLYRSTNGYKLPEGGELSEGAVTWTSGKNEVNVSGRFPANIILSHNPDCQLTGTVTDDITLNGQGNDKLFYGNFKGGQDQSPKSATSEIYNCTEGCPFLEFPNSKSSDNKWEGDNNANIYGKYSKGIRQSTYSDEGTAARFFYCAKASKSERNAGLDNLEKKPGGSNAKGYTEDVAKGNDRNKPTANFHPTVKPLTLMRYLIKLVTPPNGIVLDPFLGSGTTAVAAILEDFDWKGCEMTEDYVDIIKGRIKWAVKEKKKEQPKLL